VNTNEYLLGALRAEGLTHVFMVPGGLIDGFYPALALTPGLTPIVATHEAGAAYMADGYARAGAASAPAWSSARRA
jgi:acetolactate synthase I/II/III large subunit